MVVTKVDKKGLCRTFILKWIICSMILLVVPSLGHAVEVDLNTGTAFYQILIEVPPGTNGMQPRLALVYNSDSGNEWIGDGWNLSSLGLIERRGPAYSPAPTFTDADTFVLNSPIGGGKLVWISGDQSISNYRTQIENFLRIQFAPSQNYWTVTDKSGTQFIFGQSSGARQHGGGGAWRFYLEKVIDTHGNFYTISYDKDDTNGDIYPKQIVYTQNSGSPGLACTPENLNACRTVEFFLEARSDIKISYASTLKVTNDRRLKRIEVKMRGQLVRAYDLNYQMSPATHRGFESVSQLESITERGVNNGTLASETRVTRFTYHEANATNLIMNNQAITNPPTISFSQQPSSQDCAYAVDLFNQGRTGVLVRTGGIYQYYINEGNSFNATTISNPTLPSLCSTNVTLRRDTAIGFNQNHPGRRGRMQEYLIPVHTIALIDIDGDGLPDMVDGGTAGDWGWWRQESPGTFADRAAILDSPQAALGEFVPDSFGDTTREVRFADMDGDGLIDVARLVEATDNRTTATYDLTWWRNLGKDGTGNLKFVQNAAR